jgi:hypothetical protein
MILLPHDPPWSIDLIIASFLILAGKEHKQWIKVIIHSVTFNHDHRN